MIKFLLNQRILLITIRHIALIILILLPFIGSSQLFDVAEPIKLPESINTAHGEESYPMRYTKDGDTALYFVRTPLPKDEEEAEEMFYEEINQDIFYSNWLDSIWTEPTDDIHLNNKENNAICGISEDGNSIYILDAYQKRRTQSKGLSVATKKGKEWRRNTVEHLPLKIKIDDLFYGFYVTDDEGTMIISIKGEPTKGKEDLYVSFRKGEGHHWTPPLHLGDSINSDSADFSPFLSHDMQYLFFSTDAYDDNLGSFDIYASKRKDSTWTNWTTPVNLGDKINSKDFDAYFSIYKDSTIFFSSNRDGKYADIYQTHVLPEEKDVDDIDSIPQLTALIDTVLKDSLYLPYLPKEIEVIDEIVEEIEPLENTIETKTITPEIKEVLPLEKEEEDVVPVPLLPVAVDIEEQIADVQKTDPIVPEIKKIIEQPKEKPAIITVKGKKFYTGVKIYFDLNSSYLNKRNHFVIDSLFEVLKEEYKDLHFYIQSHTDVRASYEYNNWLAKRRANRTRQYLQKKKVNINAIHTASFGEYDPICPYLNCDEVLHTLSRRTIIYFSDHKLSPEELKTAIQKINSPDREKAKDQGAVYEYTEEEMDDMVEKTAIETGMLSGTKVYFNTNSYYLDYSTQRILDDLISKTRKDQSLKIHVRSYADIRAATNYNQWLSHKRATSVNTYLKQNGITNNRLSTSWKGENDPLCLENNCDSIQLRLSRRTIVYVYREGYDIEDASDNIRYITNAIPREDLPNYLKLISSEYASKIHFDMNSSDIDGEAKRILTNYIEELKNNTGIKIHIRSYTDITATAIYNKILSQKRARNTFQFLTDNGIKPTRITYSWHGEEEAYCKDINCPIEEHRKSRRSLLNSSKIIKKN